MGRVRVCEKKIQLARTELAGNGCSFIGDLGSKLDIAFRELIQLDQIACSTFEAVPIAD